jgi:hypothetical protein
MQFQLLDPCAAALNQKNKHGDKQNAGNNSDDHDTVHNDSPFSEKHNEIVPQREQGHMTPARRGP